MSRDRIVYTEFHDEAGDVTGFYWFNLRDPEHVRAFIMRYSDIYDEGGAVYMTPVSKYKELPPDDH